MTSLFDANSQDATIDPATENACRIAAHFWADRFHAGAVRATGTANALTLDEITRFESGLSAFFMAKGSPDLAAGDERDTDPAPIFREIVFAVLGASRWIAVHWPAMIRRADIHRMETRREADGRVAVMAYGRVTGHLDAEGGLTRDSAAPALPRQGDPQWMLA